MRLLLFGQGWAACGCCSSDGGRLHEAAIPWTGHYLFLMIALLCNSLGFRSLLLITLNISHHSILPCKVSVEKSDDILMGFPLQITNSFCFAFHRQML